jgi:hypothetical protein
MSYGPVQVFAGVLASGTSTITSIDISGKSWSRVYLEVPTMSTQAEIYVYGSTDNTTFRQVYERVNTAPVQFQGVTMPTSVSNGLVPLTAWHRYLQFRMSATVTNGATFNVVCHD